MKRIILYSFLAILLPFITMAFMVAIVDADGNVGYVGLSMLISSIMFFMSLIAVERNKPYILILVFILMIAGIIFVGMTLDKPYFGYIGLSLSGLIAFIVNRSKWFYFLEVMAVYPNIFITCGITRITLIYYLVFMCVALLFSTWLKFRKTKIYLYDNY